LEERVRERTDDLMTAYEIVSNERRRLFSVLEQIPGYVCLLTTDYRFAYVNREFLLRFGDPKDSSCHDFFHRRQMPCDDCRVIDVLVERRSQQWEWTGPDGKTYTIFNYPFTDYDGSFRILELGIDITDRKKAEEELSASREKLRLLYSHLQSAVEAEKKNIAREIHDEFGTVLTALNIDLAWLEKKMSEEQDTLKERIRKDIELVNSAIKVIQRISAELRPGVLDYLGFPAAIEWLVKDFGQRTGITVELSFNVRDFDLPMEHSIALFRILQEALNNVARHAGASKINVSLAEVDHVLILTITDDGRGIRDEDLATLTSFGILGMKERVDFLGGNLEIQGAVGVGTRVTVKIPVSHRGVGT